MCFSVVNRLGVMVAVPFGGKVLQMWRFSLLGSSIAILAFCASQVAVAIAQSGVVEAATTLFKVRKKKRPELRTISNVEGIRTTILICNIILIILILQL